MRRIWFDRDEPPVLDHRLTAAAGNAEGAKGGDAATFFGHLRYSRTNNARRRTVVCPRSRVGSPQNVTWWGRRKLPPNLSAQAGRGIASILVSRRVGTGWAA